MSRPRNEFDERPLLRLSRLEVGDHEPPRNDTDTHPFQFLTAVMQLHHIDDPRQHTDNSKRAA